MKVRERASYKLAMALAIAVGLLVGTALVARGEEAEKSWYQPDEWGVGLGAGYEIDNFNDSPIHDYRVLRFSGNAGKYLDQDKKWKLEAELQLGLHRAESTHPETTSLNATEIGVNLLPKRFFELHKSVDLYIGGVFGLSWLMDADNQPAWGDSGTLGTLGIVVGTDITLKRYTSGSELKLRFEYRGIHKSDPWNSHDVGRNLHGPAIGLTYTF
jgi:hypothetical protein